MIMSWCEPMLRRHRVDVGCKYVGSINELKRGCILSVPSYAFTFRFGKGDDRGLYNGPDARKPVFGGLRSTQVQTSLCIRAV